MFEQDQSDTTAVVKVEQQRAIQEVQAQVILARRFPRDINLARAKILAECQRPRFAEIALYQYPRGKKKNEAGQWVANIVSGPSIRLAEVMARSMQNMKFGIRVLSRKDGSSDVQTFAWDMENNVLETRDFIVKHERKSGDKTIKLTDDRDIYEMEANQGARRMRACILAMIPKDIQDEAQEETDKTMMNNLAGEKGVERIKVMLDKFAELRVVQKDIESKFGCKLKSLTVKHWAELGRIYNSLKDGIGRKDDYFGEKTDPKADTEKTTDIQDKLKKDEPKPEKKAKPKSEPEPEPDQKTPEPAKSEPELEKTVETTPEPEKASEKADFGTEKEVEEAAKTTEPVKTPIEDRIDELKEEVAAEEEDAAIANEEIEARANEQMEKEMLLKDAYPEEKAKRKTKYLREKANEVKDALAAYSDEKAPNGINNLGELCAYFNLNAITAYDITVGQYDDIMDFIKMAKDNHPPEAE